MSAHAHSNLFEQKRPQSHPQSHPQNHPQNHPQPWSATGLARACYKPKGTVRVVIAQLFLETLTGLPGDRTEAFLRTAAVAALATNNEKLLVALAKHPGVPSDMDAKIGKISTARVRAAWCSRPNRSREQISKAMASEKRSGVLAAIAASEDITVEALEQLSFDKRRAVALAVMDNKNASQQAVLRATCCLAAQFNSLPHTVRVQVQAFVLKGFVDLETVAMAATGGLLEAIMFRPHTATSSSAAEISEEVQLRAVQLLVADRIFDLSSFSNYDRGVINRSALATAKALAVSTTHVSVIDAIKAATSLLLTTSDAKHLNLALSAFDGDAVTKTVRLKKAESSSSPTVLAGLVQHAKGNRDVRLATVLVSNPKLSEPDAIMLMGVCPNVVLVETAVSRRLVQLAKEIVRLEQNEESLIKLFDCFGLELLDLSTTLPWRVCRTISNPRLASLAADLAKALPLKQLSASGFYPSLPPVMLSTIAEQLASVAPERYELVIALQHGWDGTLNELLEAVEALEGGVSSATSNSVRV